MLELPIVLAVGFTVGWEWALALLLAVLIGDHLL